MAINVRIPQPLRNLTANQSVVQATGADLGSCITHLEGAFPGIRFRMINEAAALRPHMRVFVNRSAVIDLGQPLTPTDDVVIVQALSGG